MSSNGFEEKDEESLIKCRAPKRLSQDSIKLPKIINTKIEPLFKLPDELSQLPCYKKFKSKDSEFSRKKYRMTPSKKLYTEQRLKKEQFRRYLIDLIVKPELSEKELDNIDKDVNRYHYYIQNGIDTIHVTTIEEKIIQNIILLIPEKFRIRFVELVNDLLKEVKSEFTVTMKEAIVEFALRDPLENDLVQVLIYFKAFIHIYSKFYRTFL